MLTVTKMFTNLTTLLNELFEKDQNMLSLSRYNGERIIFTDRMSQRPMFAVELTEPYAITRNSHTRQRALWLYLPGEKHGQLLGVRDYDQSFLLPNGVRLQIKPRNENGPCHGAQLVGIEAPHRVSITRAEIATPTELAPYYFSGNASSARASRELSC